MKSSSRANLLRVLALVFVIGISIFIFLIKDQVEALAEYGYIGIFFLSILANGTIILPAPGIAIVFTMAAVFNPFWVAVSSAAGAAIGEMSGYMAGFSGQAVVEQADLYEKITNWMKSHRSLSYGLITVLAAIPNPFFDLAGMASGALRVPIPIFLFYCLLGKLIKMLLIAYAGYYSFDLFFIQ